MFGMNREKSVMRQHDYAYNKLSELLPKLLKNPDLESEANRQEVVLDLMHNFVMESMAIMSRARVTRGIDIVIFGAQRLVFDVFCDHYLELGYDDGEAIKRAIARREEMVGALERLGLVFGPPAPPGPSLEVVKLMASLLERRRKSKEAGGGQPPPP